MTLTAIELNDTNGILLRAVAEDGQITVEAPIVPGDVNEDERITLVDALFILQASLGKRDLSAKPIVAIDTGKAHPVALQGRFEEEDKGRANLVLAISGLSVGALDIQLHFDPELLTWMGFETAASGEVALIDAYAMQPGELRLARLGITEAGELGQLLFQRRSSAMPTEVEITSFVHFDFNGLEQPTDVASFEGRLLALPSVFALYANAPNPFNPGTTIHYDLAALPLREAMQVRLVVYNMAGQRVRTLFDEVQQSGRYTVQWDGRDDRGNEMGSGVYLYRLDVAGHVQVRRMLLLR